MNFMEIAPHWSGLLIFCLRATDVSLGTIRMITIMRGHPAVAAVIGFVEVSIFVLAISQVITHLDNWLNVIGYAGGFSLGTFLGMLLERRIAPGYTHVRIVSAKRGRKLATNLRVKGFGVTELKGQGIYGRVDIVTTLIKRRQAREVVALIKNIDRDAFITVEESRAHYRGFFRAKKK